MHRDVTVMYNTAILIVQSVLCNQLIILLTPLLPNRKAAYRALAALTALTYHFQVLGSNGAVQN